MPTPIPRADDAVLVVGCPDHRYHLEQVAAPLQPALVETPQSIPHHG
ncbi:hypothetical protein [Allostreptomyces psammosilenae]|uniref:Uncharacterized protein n=1 Tax=Allostreptomyces psammosilenae TaxID=1892865 RepID=A0A852ZM05_9ACTN|nr:hypothetical protein [Allostreptomyces psammosilenae]NYI03429.1 hypothetical protein [Allostreptomyces psammosilenae]